MQVSTRLIVLCLALLACAGCAPDLSEGPKSERATWVMNMTAPIEAARNAVF